MMSELTELKLPESTPFPVKVSSVLIAKGDKVAKHQMVIRYTYWEYQDAPDRIDEEVKQFNHKQKVRVDLIGSFESPIDGIVENILINKNEEILSSDQPIAEILEPCTHSIQYGGLCALCGKSLEEETDYSGYQLQDRAPISMSHGTSNLKISVDEAEKVEAKMTSNLLREKRLILVVDLDQTIIHATVDPTIGEWMKDTENPNYPSLKDVQTFFLEEEPTLHANWVGPKPLPHKRWYYVKMRPGLQAFLEDTSKKYELHIYTMGTRAYAKAIAKICDPEGKFFADRILSRDESGSLTQKSLERLFPVDTSMVVIIDDRGDVWNWSDHLVKVVPFDFFVGVGDINSNFLPKRKLLLGPTKRDETIEKLEEQYLKETADAGVSKELDRLEKTIDDIKEAQPKISEEDIELSEEQNAELLAARSSEREASLEAQKSQRPLAKLQENLDKLSTKHQAKNVRLLFDDDDELIGLQNALINIHKVFYEDLEENATHPDIQHILPSMKRKVFEGCSFAFSGLFPFGTNINNESIVIWARSFGAQVTSNITINTTHLITKSPPTFKARLAKSMLPNVKVVHPNWIFNSLTNWKKLSETKYEIPGIKVLPEDEVLKYKDALSKSDDKQQSEQVQIDDIDETDGLLGGDMNWLDMDDEVNELLSSDSDPDEDEDLNLNNKRVATHDADSDESLKRKKIDDQKESEEDSNNNDDDDVDDDDFEDLAAELMLDLDEEE